MMSHSTKKNALLLCLLSTTLLASANIGSAEKIYKWKDEAGKTHFTNNEALVPLKSENTHIIKMKALPAPIIPEPILNGKDLWVKNCLQCHNLSKESVNFKKGMPRLIASITDPVSSDADPLQILQAALKDRMDDAANIELNIDESEAIIAYIKGEIILTSPSTLDESEEQAQ